MSKDLHARGYEAGLWQACIMLQQHGDAAEALSAIQLHLLYAQAHRKRIESDRPRRAKVAG